MSRRKIERDTANKGNVIDMKTGERVEQPSLPIICDRIRFYRKNQGMEQKAFAEKIGTQANTVNNWEGSTNRNSCSKYMALRRSFTKKWHPTSSSTATSCAR